MQSVASINPPEPRPTPAPDRKDKGSDSFSLMLDTAAKPPDNPAPDAGPPAGDESSPPARKTEARPADDRSVQPQDDSGEVGASCARSASDASKGGGSTAKAKDCGKSAKQSSNEDDAKDPAQAVVASDPAPSVPQIGSVPAVLVALDVLKADGGGNASAAGDRAKTEAAEIAAMAPTSPAVPEAAKPSAMTTSPAALEAAKPSAVTPAPANEGTAQAAAAIEAADKGGRASVASDTPAESDEVSKTPNIPRSAAIAALTEKAAPRAAEVAAVLNLGEPKPKASAADKAASGNVPVQPATNAEGGKPSSGGDSAAIVRLAAKAAPDARTPEPGAANPDLETAAIRPASLTAELSQSATLPEPLRALASALGPTSASPQAPGAAVSAQAVPLTSAAIAVEIAARAKEGSRQFDIRLDPPELGRIDVRLDVDKSGEVSTRLTVDRPETLQLLQNDARGLERALQSAGLKTEDGSLQFSLRQQSPDGSAGQQAQGGAEPRPGTVYVAEEESATAGLEQYQWAARLRGGVDIRV